MGWRVDAFCGEMTEAQRQHGAELLAQVPTEATLHVLPPSPRDPSYRLFPRVDGGFPNSLEYARRAVALLAADPPDVVLASGPPFFTFVAGLFVAKRFGATFVLDYRDEWSECPFDFVDKSGHDRDWERRCIKAADVVLFNTESHRRHQLATFPELVESKTHVVQNGWVPDDFATRQRDRVRPAPRQVRPFTLAHVGNLAAHAAPHDFLDALERLLTVEPELATRIRVQFVGRRGPRAERALADFKFPSVIDIIDNVGKREANRLMQDSDALLLIARKELERYLPGKLFDYLAARRPVLVFGFRGEASDLVDKLRAGVFCEAGNPSALRDAFSSLQRADLPRNDTAIDVWLDEHRRDVLAANAFNIIESAMPADRSSRNVV